MKCLLEKKLWCHEPLTDFWRVGPGTAARLRKFGLFTMGDIARASCAPLNYAINEETLYKAFGVNAEYLIDHAWGYESSTIKAIKDYRPANTSLTQGQVLSEPYENAGARIIIREMAETISYDLVKKGLLSKQIGVYVGYDSSNDFTDRDDVVYDHYGKAVPKPSWGTMNLREYSSSTAMICSVAERIFDRISDPSLTVRRLCVVANNVIRDNQENEDAVFFQGELFDFSDSGISSANEPRINPAKEKKLQQVVLGMKKKFGENAVLKAMNLQDGATQMLRNTQVGGHKA